MTATHTSEQLEQALEVLKSGKADGNVTMIPTAKAAENNDL